MSGDTANFLAGGEFPIPIASSAATGTVGTPPVPVAADDAIGIGNSPPARKLAVSPDMVVRFGSARVLTSPLVSSALNSRVRSPALVAIRLLRPPKATVLAAPARSSPVVIWKPLPLTGRAGDCELMCRSFAVVRDISTKRTDSITCCTPSTDSMLMTLPGE